MQVKVRDKKTQIERTVTKKAYEIIPHRYEFLGYVDDDGNETSGDAPVTRVQKKTEPKSVAPAVSKIEVRLPLTQVEIQEKREELKAMNQEAIQKAEVEEVIVKERRKPGPKPKAHA